MRTETFPLATLTNGRTIPLTAVPTLSADTFEQAVLDGVAAGYRVAAMFGAATHRSDLTTIYLVLSDDKQNRLQVARTEIEGDRFSSITPRCPQVHLFECEIAEQFGLKPVGHPWLKPVRYHRSRTGRDAWDRPANQPILPAVGDFFRIGGEEVHEVAVGPVHAGVIEPGHFRFQCHGEQVFHLEIALGFQHRGIEQAMIGGPTRRTIPYVETASGDATIAHTLSYCQLSEAFADCRQSARAQTLRGIALELERLANHIGDLGALANDVGYLPTASYCGRIRGDALNMTALLCGNRFGRGLIRPGGVNFDADALRLVELEHRLDEFAKDAEVAVNLLWNAQSVMARFEGIGTLPRDIAAELGIVGPAARASGLTRDIRRDQPAGIYCFSHIPVFTHDTGDVFARAYVRWLEIRHSIEFIRDQLRTMPEGEIIFPLAPPTPDSLGVALTEGWRGEVCHAAVTDGQGHFSRYKIVDPSFHNWMGLAYSLRGQEISDFPICNKSFNLSYCGHDL